MEIQAAASQFFTLPIGPSPAVSQHFLADVANLGSRSSVKNKMVQPSPN